MGVEIDWGLNAAQPSILNSLIQSYQAGRQLGLQHQADNAFSALKNDPTNADALTTLAATDPQRANAFMSVASANRAAQARQAGADYVNASNGRASVAPPSPTPQGGLGQAQAQPPALLNPAHPATQDVGAAVANGADPSDALARVVQYGGPEMAAQMQALVKGSYDLNLSKANDAANTMGRAAFNLLKSIPMDPGNPQASLNARRQAALQLAPQLAQHGITPDQIANYDYSDNGLHGLIGQAVTVDQAMAQSNADRDYALKAADQHKGVIQTVTNADGTTTSRLVDPMTGAVIGAGGSGASGGGGAPRTALAGNNPGGIQDGSFAKSQPGYTGANGRFAQFDTLEHGVAAQTALLQSYVSRGFDTPAKIAARWAPAGDGNNNPTVYAANIARQMGIGVNDKIGAAQIGAFQQAQAKQENSMYSAPGQPGSGGGGGGSTLTGNDGGGTGGLGQQGVDLAAIEYLKSGKLPTNVGRSGAANRAVIARAAQMAQDQGMSLDDVISGRAQWSASKAALAAAMKNFAGGGKGEQIVRSLGVANDHLDTLAQAAQALQNGDNRTLNALGNSIAAWSGKPAPTTFNALRDIVMDEVVKAVTGTGGALGDRESLQANFGNANSPAQLIQGIQGLKRLMGGQLTGFAREYKATTSRDDFAKFVSPTTARELGMGGQIAPVKITGDADYAKLPSGSLFIGPDGHTRRKP